jgi:hypothetical protein
MRRLRLIALGLCVFMELLALLGWTRAQSCYDRWAWMSGTRFFRYTATSGSVSLQWLDSVPPDENPFEDELGFRSHRDTNPGAPEPPNVPFINVPERTMNTASIGGLQASWGQGQILVKKFFLYRATSLRPFRGISATWKALLLYPLVPPTLWAMLHLCRRELQSHLRRQRRLQGLCPNCGYDLRASPDKCPECGAPSAAPSSIANTSPVTTTSPPSPSVSTSKSSE